VALATTPELLVMLIEEGVDVEQQVLIDNKDFIF
jgi:hypothetical protein